MVLWGRAEPEDLHGWYEAATLFVHPTLYEGSSLVTLEAMGTPEAASQKLFDAIHRQHKRLFREDDVTAVVVSAGVDKAKYESVYKSFSVESKMKRMNALIGQYKVETAPTLVVDGRYVTSPSMAGRPGMSEDQSQAAALAVADYLVAKAAAGKK